MGRVEDKWTDPEVQVLLEGFSTKAWEDLMAALPARTRRQAFDKGRSLGMRRPEVTARTPEQTRAAKRQFMADRRAANPEASRTYQRDRYSKKRDLILQKTKAYYGRRFFWAKAQRMKGVTARDLASLWKQQRGRCALTGVRLDRSAEPDHKIPKARGGPDALENLQWVTRAVNRAKRDLTDAEFVELCSRVIGTRIQMVADLEKENPEWRPLSE